MEARSSKFDLTRGARAPDIFVPEETLKRFGLIGLRPEQTVLVRYGNGPNGLIAVELRPSRTDQLFFPH